MSTIDKIMKDMNSVPFKVSIARKLGSINAALYLQQILYWYYISGKGKPFFKFRSPCKHYLYSKGDSFEDELFMSSRTQGSAFKYFGSNTRAIPSSDDSAKSIVTLTVDGNNLPWYYVDEELLKTFLSSCIDEGHDQTSSPDMTKGNDRDDERSSPDMTKGNDRDDERSSASIQENTQETTQENIIVSNEVLSEKETPEDVETSSSDKMDEPSESDDTKISYSTAFNLIWTTYNPPVTSHKGNKQKANKAYLKTSELLSTDEIMNALSLYMSDEYAFGRRPCQLSTFLNGLITNSKYREAYIDNRYAKTVTRQEGAYGKGKTAMDHYKADLTLQGPLSRDQLMDRTTELDFNLTMRYKDQGWTIGYFESHPREDWVKLLGAEYVGLRIVASSNKDKKVMVLFTIEELRKNLYVHYHGYEWNEALEKRYNDQNEAVLLAESHIEEAVLIEDKTKEVAEEELFD